MKPMIIHITGPGHCGKTLLARWIERANALRTVTVLEYSECARRGELHALRALAATKITHEMVICVGDWPSKKLRPELEIRVARGIGAGAGRYSIRLFGTACPLCNALPCGKSPTKALPDSKCDHAARRNTGTKHKSLADSPKGCRAGSGRPSQASAGIFSSSPRRITKPAQPAQA